MAKYEVITNYHFKWDKILPLDISRVCMCVRCGVLCCHLGCYSHAESSLYFWHLKIMHSKTTTMAKTWLRKLQQRHHLSDTLHKYLICCIHLLHREFSAKLKLKLMDTSWWRLSAKSPTYLTKDFKANSCWLITMGLNYWLALNRDGAGCPVHLEPPLHVLDSCTE